MRALADSECVMRHVGIIESQRAFVGSVPDNLGHGAAPLLRRNTEVQKPKGATPKIKRDQSLNKVMEGASTQRPQTRQRPVRLLCNGVRSDSSAITRVLVVGHFDCGRG
jgi:hypothetical protein